MHRSAASCFFSFSIALLSLSAVAESDAERRYLVEVVIFEYIGPDSSDGELWQEAFTLPPETPDDLSRGVEAVRSTDMSTSGEVTPEAPEELIVHQAELLHMVDIVAKLENSPRYGVLFQRAWTQPLRNRSDAIPVPMGLNPWLTADLATAMVYTPPSPVSGAIKMFEQRLLFIAVDIAARLPTALGSNPDLPLNPTRLEYRITETRRVKLNEVHYFDHPFFGVLVRVSRVEPGRLEFQPSPLMDEEAPEVRTPGPPTSVPPN